MHTRSRLVVGFSFLAIALSSAPRDALAQAWLEDRARTEGPGFRVGDFELHPGLGVELGYDSNIYYTQDGDTSGRFRDSGILRATAHFLFSTRGEQRRREGESGGGEEGRAPAPTVRFRGGVSGAFYHFFNDSTQTNMEVDASLALGILPGRPFSIDISEDFGRSIRPFSENPGIASYGRIQNTAAVGFNFATAGEILKITTGYAFGIDFFEFESFQYGNNFRHTISLSETFRFLPQTGIVHDTSVTVIDYFNENAPMAPTLVNDGLMLRTRIGINGALTTNFSVLVAGGYGAGFFFSHRTMGRYEMEYESVVAQAEARWQISENVRLAFGYDRDFHPSFLGNFYRRDRGYANFQALVAGSFMLGLEASVGYYEFGSIVQPDGMTMVGTTGLSRGDVRLVGSLFAEYRFTDWLGVNGTLRYTGNFTDYVYVVPMFLPPVDPANFNKFEAWIGVRVFY